MASEKIIIKKKGHMEIDMIFMSLNYYYFFFCEFSFGLVCFLGNCFYILFELALKSIHL